jgi:hypothetical protein
MHPSGEHGWTYKVYFKNSFKHNPFEWSYMHNNTITNNAPVNKRQQCPIPTNGIDTNSEHQQEGNNYNNKNNSEINEINEILESYSLPTAQPTDSDGQTYKEHHDENSSQFVSCREFYAYRLQMRPYSITNHRCYTLMFDRLLQQYIVDQYAKIEGECLRWYRDNQDDFLTAQHQGLADAYTADDGTTASDISRPTVLPSSFTGGPRHMH